MTLLEQLSDLEEALLRSRGLREPLVERRERPAEHRIVEERPSQGVRDSRDVALARLADLVVNRRR